MPEAMKIVQYISLSIGAMGAAVIVWGSLLSLISLVSLEYIHLKGENICQKRELVRHHFGSYILLGLEFMVAADVLRTVIHPTLNEMAVLGALVAIRTVLSYFVNLEISGHECGSEKESDAGKEIV